MSLREILLGVLPSLEIGSALQLLVVNTQCCIIEFSLVCNIQYIAVNVK